MSLSRDAAGEAFYMHGGVNHIDTRGALWYNCFHRGNRNLSSGGKRMICLVCGRDNPNYAVVCEQCGNFLPREEPGKKVRGLLDPIAKGKIRCSYCWSDNEATDTACRMCGMPLGFVPYSDSGAGAPGLSDKPIEGMPTEDEFFGEAGEDDLYGNLGLNDPEFWEQANKELTEEPETFETPVVNVVPENVTPVANPVPEGMVRCRSCSKDNDRNATHCEFCGKKLPVSRKTRRVDDADYDIFKTLRESVIYCVYCGQEQEWSSITCPSCGYNPRVGRQAGDEYHAPQKDAPMPRLSYYGRSKLLDLAEERIAKEEEQRKIEDSKLRGSKILPPGARKCRSCWLINRAGTAVCVGCGAPLGSESQQARDDVLRRKAAAVMQQKECTCGYANDPSVAICARCGGTVKRKCPHCGYSNLPKVTICANCHARLAMPKKPKL